MSRDEIRKLIGGYATGTLGEAERKILFEAALEDQELFEELEAEQALKEMLDQPGAKQRLIAALAPKPKPFWARSWAWASVATAVAAAVLLVVVMQQRRPAPVEMAKVQVAEQQSPAIAPTSAPAVAPTPPLLEKENAPQPAPKPLPKAEPPRVTSIGSLQQGSRPETPEVNRDVNPQGFRAAPGFAPAAAPPQIAQYRAQDGTAPKQAEENSLRAKKGQQGGAADAVTEAQALLKTESAAAVAPSPAAAPPPPAPTAPAPAAPALQGAPAPPAVARATAGVIGGVPGGVAPATGAPAGAGAAAGAGGRGGRGGGGRGGGRGGAAGGGGGGFAVNGTAANGLLTSPAPPVFGFDYAATPDGRLRVTPRIDGFLSVSLNDGSMPLSNIAVRRGVASQIAFPASATAASITFTLQSTPTGASSIFIPVDPSIGAKIDPNPAPGASVVAVIPLPPRQ